MRLRFVAAAAAAIAGLAFGAPSAAAADRDCGDFANQAAAQDYFLSIGGPDQDPDQLDGDNDGVACESLPCPCRETAAPPPPAEQPRPREKIAARIVSVTDGDTIRVRTRAGRILRTRLIGVDAPETNHPEVGRECGGREATANLKRLSFRRVRGTLLGRAVTLTTDPTQPRKDRHGRLLAYARTDARRELGREQLLAGWADVYETTPAFERTGAYRSAATAARTRGRGVWGRCGGDFDRPA